MNDYKIALLAKWIADNPCWRENDPDIEVLDQMNDVAEKAYHDGGRFSEGSRAAAEAVIRFVLEMET